MSHFLQALLPLVLSPFVALVCFLIACVVAATFRIERRQQDAPNPHLVNTRVDGDELRRRAALARRKREESPANQRTPAPWFDEDGAA